MGRNTGAAGAGRLPAIDWMRGIVMVLMALDHVRWFFTNVPFPPEATAQTTLGLFLTRWVTHFCAPGFFLLAGMSAYLGGRRRTPGSQSRHLVMRGLWLIALEVTVIGFGWNFTPGHSFAGVIWALGWSMVLLALLIHVDARLVAAGALLFIGLHNAVGGFMVPGSGPLAVTWRLLHVPGGLQIGPFGWSVLYPLIPWAAVMALGYTLGPVWLFEQPRRQRFLMVAGSAAFLLFVLLRVTNSYGNPATGGAGRLPFEVYRSWDKTLVSLLNVCKYPASLQFLLMTLGPLLVGLGLADRALASPKAGTPKSERILATFGSVPLLYYITHLYLIHGSAYLIALGTGQPSQWLGWRGDQSIVPPPGYGYGLGVVYLAWAGVLLALYFPCRAFGRFKATHRGAWTRLL